ncbi:MAG: hypothetical protein KBF88_02145 [Polyangiaceae bacterium]|nr:hypothetical protein [Polyangiaceae bacterium]
MEPARAPTLLLRISAFVLFIASASFAGYEEEFAVGTAALKDGRASDAIASFERLADQGVRDANVSYNRGLAYVLRARTQGTSGAGDLGQAVHGFEEALELGAGETRDHARSNLNIVRGEIAKRRAQKGIKSEFRATAPASYFLARFLRIRTWALLTLLSSVLLTLALFGRKFARGERSRIAWSGLLVGSTLLFALVGPLTFLASRAANTTGEAIVIVDTARPMTEKGVPVPNADALSEGARVQIVGKRDPLVEISAGPNATAWVLASALRPLTLLETP